VYDSRRVKTANYKRGKQKSEFEFEMAAFAAAMKSGWKECPEIPHAQSLSMMQMSDFIRRQLGISYEEIQITQIPDMISTASSQTVTVNETIIDQNTEGGREEEAAVSSGEETVVPEAETVIPEEGTVMPGEETEMPEEETVSAEEETLSSGADLQDETE
jgi:hypothetical protein